MSAVSNDQDQTTKGFRVFWSIGDQEWVGLSETFPSLSWLAATPEEAIRGIYRLHRQTALEQLAELGQEIGYE